MQTNKEQLKRQQEVLKARGFYNGRSDGIWGPKSITAKREFEGDKTFSPAYPSNGLPFNLKQPLPAGVTIDIRNRNMITCDGIQTEEVESVKTAEAVEAVEAVSVEVSDEVLASDETVDEAVEADLSDRTLAHNSNPQSKKHKQKHRRG